MDYGIDLVLMNDDVSRRVAFSEFMYDDRRICSKLYVFLKLIGVVFYTTSLTRCDNPEFFMIMIGIMFLATINSIRYEMVHLKRYGTIFSSINEYNSWKNEQWPKSRLLFSIIELAIKIGFFVKTFPPIFGFKDLCEIGQSIFKIHILILFISYFMIGILGICILPSFYCFDSSAQELYRTTYRISQIVSSPIPILITNNQNEECCICLDIDSTESWSILPCGHKFHGVCISNWINTHKTCPICRLYMSGL